ncbi:MAG TPA: class I SAM-dependent methyltransferase [Armatimonadota bacterium]|nr:class I SAM-dependent methyltransferase [Armatimonadota bacterium]
MTDTPFFDIAAYYNASADSEWGRLARDAYHQLEFQLTMHFLCKYLPPEGVILDAGGGPGRYTLALCRLGYEVVLLDLAEGLLARAREQLAQEPAEVQARVRDIVQGDIRDLSAFPDGAFAATLCLGCPLAHIHDEAERRHAMSELARVTKDGGIIAVSVVGLLAAHRIDAWKFDGRFLLDDAYMARILREQNSTRWHFFRAAELRALAESAGLATLEMAGLESLATGLPDATNRLCENPVQRQRWLDLLLRYATEPAVVDMAEHMLYIGRK